MSEQSIQGACLCGTVRFEITGDILGFQYCHCTRCRRFTGSAHAANLFVRPEQLSWLSGEGEIGTWVLHGEPNFHTAWCKQCGCSLPNMSTTGKFWVCPAGTLDDDPGERPKRSIYWDSRAPWYEEVSELPKHAEMPPRN